MIEDTRYPGVFILSDSPDQYTKDGDRVRVPHNRPVEGQFLADTNYYEMTAGKTTTDQMAKAMGIGVEKVIKLESFDIKHTDPVLDDDDDDYEDEEEFVPVKPAKKSRTRKPKAVKADPPKPKHKVIWEVPGLGKVVATYNKVCSGQGCFAVGVSADDKNVFIPVDYRTNQAAIYNVLYNSVEYRLIYSGLNYVDDNLTVYVLLGDRI